MQLTQLPDDEAAILARLVGPTERTYRPKWLRRS